MEQASRVRAFTRTWTAVNDVLDESYLGTPYGLAEARILYELSQRDATALVDLRTTLRLDPGYATRLLARLGRDGLIERTTDRADARRQIVALTLEGHAVARTLGERSTERVSGLLARFGPDERSRLCAALDDARAILEATSGNQAGSAPGTKATTGATTGAAGGASTGTSRPDPAPTRVRVAGPGDLGWVLERHAVLYRREFGWGDAFEASVAHIVAGLAATVDDPGQRGWVAERPPDARVGSIYCAREDHSTARLRLLLTEPETRGTGLGRRLVETCLAFAREAGYRAVVLNTQDACAAARRIYASAGFTLVRATRAAGYDPTGLSEDWRLTL